MSTFLAVVKRAREMEKVEVKTTTSISLTTRRLTKYKISIMRVGSKEDTNIVI